MVLLRSTFIDCRSPMLGSHDRPVFPLNMRRLGCHSPSVFSVSVQHIDGKHYAQRKNAPSPYTWISFFLSGSLSEALVKPFVEDASAAPMVAGTEAITGFDSSDNDAQAGQVRILSKNGPRRRASFTPQKARELRKKMREIESFHDTMYHSAIAARLASQDY
ncbi:hypothetical protein KP509_16G073200 [Ceratopteris richardii]|uniref:Uncharacterized protein n=1 Tax=Ceratopteris richardii TaxID=49495 RepID=A0A8T2T377_CERRI|nr:hypothetical protein KP509_16G073200 [Ceratopteris richardii]